MKQNPSSEAEGKGGEARWKLGALNCFCGNN